MKKCKFGSKCEYLHDTLAQHQDDNQFEETSNKDMEALQRQVTALLSENTKLRLKLEEKVWELDELNTVQNETVAVNKSLVEDIDAINEKMKLHVANAAELENEKLRENISILQTVVQIYKQAEIDEENLDTEEELMEDDNIEHEHPKLYSKFPCDECDFESDSRRGLSVHTGMKHKKAYERVEQMIDL